MKKTYRHLSKYDRNLIFRLNRQRCSVSFIAKCIGVHRSTIYRELKRNGCPDYRNNVAHESACTRRSNANKRRAKIKFLHLAYIEERLLRSWSPEQIASHFPREFGFSITPKSIYRFIYDDSRHWSRLRKHLRKKSRIKRSNWRFQQRKPPTKLPRITERPQSANLRQEFGHWEIDVMEGPKQKGSSLLVMLERKSRYSLARLVPDLKADTIIKALKQAFKPYVVKSITTDNGSEFRKHLIMQKTLKAPVYYCHPYRSWEKGSVENVIGLYREFFPKKTTLPEHQILVTPYQKLINERPKKVNNFRSPISFLPLILKE